MVKRKLRKGTHGYINVQVPEVMREELGWIAGEDVEMKREGTKLIIEKLGVRRYGEKDSINNMNNLEVVQIVES
jgi:bifunctional DNA-binding transcriptional regulator/antitoxin component of YhaV-PrlF toxin-antitoxin module